MKYLLLYFITIIVISSCKKDDIAPVDNTNPYVNKYAGSYEGIFSEITSGVDSNGVFKFDTSYSYTTKVNDEGNFNISIHGATEVPLIPVDSNGYFIFEAYNRTIEGWFYGDSLHISSKALNGSPVPPLWFDIAQLEFKGKKKP